LSLTVPEAVFIMLHVEIVKPCTEIAETKAELVKWIVSVGVLQTAIIGALLMKLIPG
jgi:hypothetical protein